MEGFVNTTQRWSWLHVQVEGDDLVVRHVKASNFGDQADVDSGQDNGIGSGGWPVAANPHVAVVALPYRVASHSQFKDSPIPAGLPVKRTATKKGCLVRVYCPGTGKTVDAELADLGPSLYVGPVWNRRYLYRPIDLSKGTVEALGLKMSTGEYVVDFRVVGGAKYLSPDMKP